MNALGSLRDLKADGLGADVGVCRVLVRPDSSLSCRGKFLSHKGTRHPEKLRILDAMTRNWGSIRLPDRTDIVIGAVPVLPMLCESGQMTIVGCGSTFSGGA
ncbi:hypothetical protein [Nocardia farcinica]|uniref:hypothetical protein n=1 Tax=Nocardia farcinica TaxID=37329 RepID=UPI002455E35F|nr:hypothetical protein [Nocardia farcinica]